MRLLVLGIGNPIRGDDSIGIEIARRIKSKISEEQKIQIDVKEARTTTLDLLTIIPNYDKVIIIDAIKTKRGKVGDIYRIEANKLKETCHYSVHNSSLSSTLKLGKKLGLKTPEIIIYGIKIKDTSFGETLSEELLKAFPKAVSKITGELKNEFR